MKIKRKGCYCYTTPLDGPKSDMDWNQNLSALVIPKVAEAALVHGADIVQAVHAHPDIMDFMIRGKVPRASRLIMERDDVIIILPNTIRYYVSTTGGYLFRIMPPPPGCKVGAWKRANSISEYQYREVMHEVGDGWDERIHTKNRSTYQERKTALDKGWTVTDCSNMNSFHGDIDYNYYISEVKKIVEPLL